MSTRKFLVVADDTPEVSAALRYACRRAASTGGRVSLLRTVAPSSFEHWSGVRDEIERQTRAEAEAVLQRHAEEVVRLGGQPPELLLRDGEPAAGIRAVVSEDPDIKVLVLAAAIGRGGPGPLVSSVAKEGVVSGGRRLAVTIVPGDLSDEEVADLA
jgi:nucleotide-binding universal stress UspA family protein